MCVLTIAQLRTDSSAMNIFSWFSQHYKNTSMYLRNWLVITQIASVVQVFWLQCHRTEMNSNMYP